MRVGVRWVAICGLLSLAGCAASAPSLGAPGSERLLGSAHISAADPLESLNRQTYNFSSALDRAVVGPLVGCYRRLLPQSIRHAVHNVLQNADEPLVFVNDVLQAHFGVAARTAVRFTSNTVVGIGGIFDPASRSGLSHHDNGFGATLGRYGVGPGAYIYIPLLGPTDLRDAIGAAFDYAVDPLSWIRFRGASSFGVTRLALSLTDQRLEVDDDLRALDATALDPYATMRSVYLQSRLTAIEGADASLEALPDLPPPTPDTHPDAPPQTVTNSDSVKPAAVLAPPELHSPAAPVAG